MGDSQKLLNAGTRKSSGLIRFRKQFGVQLMVWAGLSFVIFFRYIPIYGIQLAFRELLPGRGIWDSPFVGLKHFRDFFGSSYFKLVMTNTLALSFMKLLFGFPAPIIFALMLNEIVSQKARSLIQGISYLPHFLSWVIIYGALSNILNRDGGTLNSILLSLGWIDEPIHFLGTPSLFWPLMVILDIWKETGWSAIIYMAAMAGIDPQLYEAARVDGAGKLRQIISITLPSILPIIITLFILRVGSILDAGFDQLLVFRNQITFDKANILDIYVMDVGVSQGRYSYATAVGLFKSVIGFVMVLTANTLANRNDQGIW